MDDHDSVPKRLELNGFDLEQLCAIARRKYLDQVPTIQLLREARDHHEREGVGIVALLDVDDGTIECVLDGLSEQQRCELLHCLRALKHQVHGWLHRQTA
ncbi:MAG: hypothetical protein ACOCXA_03220 [Planctomycetota bacterium]